uniref:CASP-like protein n=1 Tax=Kalanchoe fedtschenkoi TaxID=63787 RepID=A0A7N0VGJ3_KALFE
MAPTTAAAAAAAAAEEEGGVVVQPVVLSRPPSSSGVLPTMLVLRALTVALTFISLIVLATTTAYARYVLFTMILGLLYSLLQAALTVYHLSSGKRVSNILVYLDFFGDLVLTYALATGAAACFAATVDTRKILEEEFPRLFDDAYGNLFGKFFEKGDATGSMLFIGSICSSVSVVLSAFGLRDRF